LIIRISPKSITEQLGEVMMTAREHAEELRQEAIKTLLAEKAAVEELLGRLGYQKEAPSPKRRGRLLITAREEAPPPVEEPISRTARPDEAGPTPSSASNATPTVENRSEVPSLVQGPESPTPRPDEAPVSTGNPLNIISFAVPGDTREVPERTLSQARSQGLYDPTSQVYRLFTRQWKIQGQSNSAAGEMVFTLVCVD
jgi:hypothetical protein